MARALGFQIAALAVALTACGGIAESGSGASGGSAGSVGSGGATGGASNTGGTGAGAGGGNAGGSSTGGTGGDAGKDTSPEGGVCAPKTKLCNGACVALDDEKYGCTASGCTPCSAPKAMFMACSGDECVVTQCHAGWADCDGFGYDGCEIYLMADYFNCGACGKTCTGYQTCKNGTCQ